MDFIAFSIIFVVLNIGLDFLTSYFIKIPGLDFLFFAPWLAATKFGIYNAFILAVVLLIIHTLFHIRILFYSFTALPAQILAIFLGSFLGIGGFYPALVLYLIASSIFVAIMGGFGGRYSVFLFVNFLFNSFAFYVMTGLIK